MSTKQAVVFIHGIGEQRPMSTLREFVKALTGEDYSSKPDSLSESFELRRLDYVDKETKDTTHFYEYYWAYRMRETRFAHLFDWMARLMLPPWGNLYKDLRKDPPHTPWLFWRNLFQDLRRDPPQHPRLFRLFVILWILFFGLLAVSGLIACGAIPGRGLITFAKVSIPVILVARLVQPLLSGFFLNLVGDAARYLNPAPSNIAERHAIRADGIALLKKLHDPAHGYDRIVIVGHSLGSVIGYDILKHYWAEVNRKMPIYLGSPAFKALQKVERSAKRLGDSWETKKSQKIFQKSQEIFQKRQHNLWKALKNCQYQQQQWLVSDFVTLGSPLSYGAFLLAESSEDFKWRVKQRELPVCPPVSNGGDKRPKSFAYEDKDYYWRLYLHHAAPFSLTQWTNLYYPGDLIAGPLTKVFSTCCVPEVPVIRAPGIRDYKLNGGAIVISHTWYWRDPEKSCDSVKHLKEIIRLKDRKHCQQ